MTNFYPGPSKLHPEIKYWMQDAVASGILERNHRSTPFMRLLENTLFNFKKSQGIPSGYDVCFTSSATECWEILNQSLLHGRVRFLYNGAFGKKWFRYAVSNQTPFISDLRGSRFEIHNTPQLGEPDYDSLCLVHSETSNGSVLPTTFWETLPSKPLTFVDATSCLGAVKLPWEKADAWFCSSQKGLGLPPGMGILISSARLRSKAEELNESNHYNSFLTINNNFRKYQTHYTPNILLIYLLNEISKKYDDISSLAQKTEYQYNILKNIIESSQKVSFLIANESLRSKTVTSLKSDNEIIKDILQKAEKNHLILGRGYGEWRDSTFRVANFPAHNLSDFQILKDFFDELQL